jgi:phytoene synthase
VDLESRLDELRERHGALVPGDRILSDVLDDWRSRVRVATDRALGEGARGERPGVPRLVLPHGRGPTGVGVDSRTTPEVARRRVADRARAVGSAEAWPRYFARHGRTFRFASRLFPGEALRRVSEVYAFCRFTDDLADEPDATGADRGALLDAWLELARRGYDGESTGVPLVDVVLGRMAESDVPFVYVEELVAGVRSNQGRVRVADAAELERYCYRVAGVVGGWVTQLFGVHDPAVLERAHRLGEAMQLTNILRDVGEDWARDRLYLPTDLLERHGLDEEDVGRLVETGGPMPERYRAALEELMARADRAYEEALAAVPALPTWYQRPVVVAARVYQGIHREVRRNGWDNASRRAWTSLPRKLWLGAGALLELRRLRRRAREPFAATASERGLRGEPGLPVRAGGDV